MKIEIIDTPKYKYHISDGFTSIILNIEELKQMNHIIALILRDEMVN